MPLSLQFSLRNHRVKYLHRNKAMRSSLKLNDLFCPKAFFKPLDQQIMVESLSIRIYCNPKALPDSPHTTQPLSY